MAQTPGLQKGKVNNRRTSAPDGASPHPLSNTTNKTIHQQPRLTPPVRIPGRVSRHAPGADQPTASRKEADNDSCTPASQEVYCPTPAVQHRNLRACGSGKGDGQSKWKGKSRVVDQQQEGSSDRSQEPKSVPRHEVERVPSKSLKSSNSPRAGRTSRKWVEKNCSQDSDNRPTHSNPGQTDGNCFAQALQHLVDIRALSMSADEQARYLAPRNGVTLRQGLRDLYGCKMLPSTLKVYNPHRLMFIRFTPSRAPGLCFYSCPRYTHWSCDNNQPQSLAPPSGFALVLVVADLRIRLCQNFDRVPVEVLIHLLDRADSIDRRLDLNDPTTLKDLQVTIDNASILRTPKEIKPLKTRTIEEGSLQTPQGNGPSNAGNTMGESSQGSEHGKPSTSRPVQNGVICADRQQMTATAWLHLREATPPVLPVAPLPVDSGKTGMSVTFARSATWADAAAAVNCYSLPLAYHPPQRQLHVSAPPNAPVLDDLDNDAGETGEDVAAMEQVPLFRQRAPLTLPPGPNIPPLPPRAFVAQARAPCGIPALRPFAVLSCWFANHFGRRPAQPLMAMKDRLTEYEDLVVFSPAVYARQINIQAHGNSRVVAYPERKARRFRNWWNGTISWIADPSRPHIYSGMDISHLTLEALAEDWRGKHCTFLSIPMVAPMAGSTDGTNHIVYESGVDTVMLPFFRRGVNCNYTLEWTNLEFNGCGLWLVSNVGSNSFTLPYSNLIHDICDRLELTNSHQLFQRIMVACTSPNVVFDQSFIGRLGASVKGDFDLTAAPISPEEYYFLIRQLIIRVLCCNDLTITGRVGRGRPEHLREVQALCASSKDTTKRCWSCHRFCYDAVRNPGRLCSSCFLALKSPPTELFWDPSLPKPISYGSMSVLATSVPQVHPFKVKDKPMRPYLLLKYKQKKQRRKCLKEQVCFIREAKHPTPPSTKGVGVQCLWSFGIPVVVFQKDNQNAMIALERRVMLEPKYVPAPDVFSKAEEWFWRTTELPLHGPDIYAFCNPADLQELGFTTADRDLLRVTPNAWGFFCMDPPIRSWVSSGSYNAKRKRVLIREALFYAERGFVPRHRLFKSILKVEKAALGQRYDTTDPTPSAPRLIQAPPELTHCILGPILKALTFFVEELFHVDCFSTYAGGKSPAALKEWINQVAVDRKTFRSGVIGLENDYSMFDATIGYPAMSCAKRIYYGILSNYSIQVNEEMMERVFTTWERPHGFVQGVEYLGPYCNASGRDDTSLLNFLLNHLAMNSSLCCLSDHVDVSSVQHIPVPKYDYRGIFLGDDSLIVSNFRFTADDITRNVAQFGFQCTPNIRTEPQHCVFLAHRPMPSPLGGLCWTPTFGRAVYKSGATLSQQPPQAVIRGMLESWSYDYRFDLLLATYCRIGLEKMQRGPVVPFDRGHKLNFGVPSGGREEYLRRPICAMDYFDFLLDVYGVDIGDFHEFINILNESIPPAYIHCRLLEKVFSVDDL